MAKPKGYPWGAGEKNKWRALPAAQRGGYEAFATRFRSRATEETWKKGRTKRYGDVIIAKWKELSEAQRNTWKDTGEGLVEAEGEDENGDVDANGNTGRNADGNDAEKDAVRERPSSPFVVSPVTKEKDSGYNPSHVHDDIEDAADRQRELGFDGTWKFVKALYRRRERAGDDFRSWNHLYVGLDEHQTARDRIAIKNIEFKNWKDHVPALARITKDKLQRYDNFPVCNSIVRQRTHSEYTRGPYYGLRAYTDYCPFQDLYSILSLYEKGATLTANKQIPEPFIWLVIRNVAEALFVLEHGKTPLADEDPANHTPIIHLDIKTGNIFCDEPIDPYRAYPNPRLGDFDSHIQATELERNENGFYGTPGFMSPEQELQDKLEISPKSDIFSLGLVISDLTRASLGNKPNQAAREQIDFGNPVDLSRDGAHEIYTAKLLDLEARCLILEPEDRPSALEVWEEATNMLIGLQDRVTGPFLENRVPDHLWLVRYKEEAPLGRVYEFRKRKRDDEDTGDAGDGNNGGGGDDGGNGGNGDDGGSGDKGEDDDHHHYRGGKGPYKKR